MGGPKRRTRARRRKAKNGPSKLGRMFAVPSTAGCRRFRLSRPNGPWKATTRPRRIPKFPAPTKAKASPKEKV